MISAYLDTSLRQRGTTLHQPCASVTCSASWRPWCQLSSPREERTSSVSRSRLEVPSKGSEERHERSSGSNIRRVCETNEVVKEFFVICTNICLITQIFHQMRPEMRQFERMFPVPAKLPMPWTLWESLSIRRRRSRWVHSIHSFHQRSAVIQLDSTTTVVRQC